MSANRSITPDIAGIRNLRFVNLFTIPCFASHSQLVFAKDFGIKKKKEKERERQSNIL